MESSVTHSPVEIDTCTHSLPVRSCSSYFARTFFLPLSRATHTLVLLVRQQLLLFHFCLSRPCIKLCDDYYILTLSLAGINVFAPPQTHRSLSVVLTLHNFSLYSLFNNSSFVSHTLGKRSSYLIIFCVVNSKDISYNKIELAFLNLGIINVC